MRAPRSRFPLAFFTLLVACGGSAGVESIETTPASQPVAVAGEGAIAIPESARLPPTEVSLLEPGDGEPELLRFTAQPGQVEGMRLTTVMTMTLTLGDQSLPTVEMPPMHMDFQVETTAVDDGLMRHRFTVRGIEVEGEGPLAEQLRRELAPLARMTGWDVMDARGRIVAAEYELPEDASPQVRRSLERMTETLQQLMPPLPEEPVAVGAKWKAVSQIRSQVQLEQVATYTLEEREGERIVLSIQTEQSAEPQPMESDQPGVTARLQSLEGAASGRAEIQLDGLVPVTEAQAEVRLDSEVTAEGQPPRAVKMTMGVRTRTDPMP